MRILEQYVNEGVDKLLFLVPVVDVEKRLENAFPVRAVRVLRVFLVRDLQETKTDQIKTFGVLEGWRSSAKHKDGFFELVQSLVLAATLRGRVPNSNRLQWTDTDETILGIKDPGKRARLYGFVDADKEEIIIVSGHYLKQGLPKAQERIQQDRAIAKAAQARRLWEEATPLVETRMIRVGWPKKQVKEKS